jgi:hypothetical protein
MLVGGPVVNIMVVGDGAVVDVAPVGGDPK